MPQWALNSRDWQRHPTFTDGSITLSLELSGPLLEWVVHSSEGQHLTIHFSFLCVCVFLGVTDLCVSLTTHSDL